MNRCLAGVLATLAASSVFAQESLQPGSSQPRSPRQIAQETFPSVAMLIMQDGTGQPTSLGSGFVLRDGLVVTNLHVVAGAVSGYCKLVDKSVKYEIAGTVAIDEAHDLAVVVAQGLKAPSLSIGDSSKIAVGDEVYAVGNPRGLEGTFSQGIVSAIRRIGNDTLLQITAPISPGSSGGPILDSGGRVVGVATATFTEGQNLNLAIPSSYLMALSAGVSTSVLPLSRQKPGAQTRSILGGMGAPSSQALSGGAFEWTSDDLGYHTGRYSFSLRNQLRESVVFAEFLVVFLDGDGHPVDVDRQTFGSPKATLTPYTPQIPGGLAKRLFGSVDRSVWELTKRVEFRILDFQVAE